MVSISFPSGGELNAALAAVPSPWRERPCSEGVDWRLTEAWEHPAFRPEPHDPQGVIRHGNSCVAGLGLPASASGSPWGRFTDRGQGQRGGIRGANQT